MTEDVAAALNAFRAFAEPRKRLGDSLFRLACSFEEPATEAEIATAWPGVEVPGELLQAWSTSRQSRLFEDVDYGQWGLVLLSPADATNRTAFERALRPDSYRPDDVVVREFLGDQEILVVAPSSTDGLCQVLIAMPLDDRSAWPCAASSLREFLDRYRDALGSKYWEQAFE